MQEKRTFTESLCFNAKYFSKVPQCINSIPHAWSVKRFKAKLYFKHTMCQALLKKRFVCVMFMYWIILSKSLVASVFVWFHSPNKCFKDKTKTFLVFWSICLFLAREFCQIKCFHSKAATAGLVHCQTWAPPESTSQHSHAHRWWADVPKCLQLMLKCVKNRTLGPLSQS